MIATLIEDAKVLIPNVEHQNFTEGKDVIKKGTEINGSKKVIAGLRRGEPFEYRLFLTTDNKLIYINKIKNMETESGIDATTVNLKQNLLAKPAILAAIGGAVIGFGIAKYKKQDMKKALLYTLIGAAAGFIGGKLVSHTGIVKSSK